jgi:hypothetical protein
MREPKIAASFVTSMKKTITRPIIYTILFIVLLLKAREGIVSQIIPNSIPLDDVLRQSCCVVAAKKADAFTHTEKIPITPRNPEAGKEYPPFIKTSYRFIVLEVLYSGRSISPGQVIQVVSPSQKHLFVMHQTCYLGHPVPSVIVPGYQNSVELDKADKLILFLSAIDNSGFEFTAENAFESISKQADIVKRLDAIKR